MDQNPLLQLRELGQSVWMDDLTRPMIREHELEALIRKDGLSGVTTNPSIFRAAFMGSSAYDAQVAELTASRIPAEEIYERLIIDDVKSAADLLYATFEEMEHRDGFVSIEVSPRLANDATATIEEAERLWSTIERPNVLIKIPGTDSGLVAIEQCLSRGINVNITLLFSIAQYRRVMEAYASALEKRLSHGEDIEEVRSVASFFVSRVDAKVDERLDLLGSRGGLDDRARKLRGRAAIAWAKYAYQVHRQMLAGERWGRLFDRGARIQKPLWASTSTKDPAYSDVKYIEALIGPDTIDTMPRATLDAFRNHGTVRPTIEENLEDEMRSLKDLSELGIDLEQVAGELLEEGITKFVKPYEEALSAIDQERKSFSAIGLAGSIED
jgi:transaldolase